MECIYHLVDYVNILKRIDAVNLIFQQILAPNWVKDSFSLEVSSIHFVDSIIKNFQTAMYAEDSFISHQCYLMKLNFLF